MAFALTGIGNWSCMEFEKASGHMSQSTEGDGEHTWGIFFVPWRGAMSIILARLSAGIPTQLHGIFTYLPSATNEGPQGQGGIIQKTDLSTPNLSDSQLPSRTPRSPLPSPFAKNAQAPHRQRARGACRSARGAPVHASSQDT